MANLQKSSPKLNSLGGVKFYPVPIGLTWEHDILVLKPSPCIHNGSEIDNWMGLDEWNSWFKAQVPDSRTGAKTCVPTIFAFRKSIGSRWGRTRNLRLMKRAYFL
ncbi:uncharacterized protein TNCV_4007381 [Trichonephila clavipes]|nr:uncharacterized protein TNCV_4007381 [Trichonephila clavipes]